jgi:hypothetical protein
MRLISVYQCGLWSFWECEESRMKMKSQESHIAAFSSTTIVIHHRLAMAMDPTTL